MDWRYRFHFSRQLRPVEVARSEVHGDDSVMPSDFISAEHLAFSEIQDCCLLPFLCAAYSDQRPDSIKLRQETIYIHEISDLVEKRAIEGITERKLISHDGSYEYWSITAKGLNYCEKSGSDSRSFLGSNYNRLAVIIEEHSIPRFWYAAGLFEDLLTIDGGLPESSSNEDLLLLGGRAPASDRYVEIDHNSQEYRDLSKKIDLASDAIRDSNTNTQYDKKVILDELSIGRRLLSNSKIRIGAAVALLFTPLYTAYHDFASDALRPIVGQAIIALKKLLGL